MHHGIGHMVKGGGVVLSWGGGGEVNSPLGQGQRSTTCPLARVKGQPPPSQGPRSTTYPGQGQRSTTSPCLGSKVNHPPAQSQRSTTFPRIHMGTTIINGRAVRILLECILVVISLSMKIIEIPQFSHFSLTKLFYQPGYSEMLQ